MTTRHELAQSIEQQLARLSNIKALSPDEAFDLAVAVTEEAHMLTLEGAELHEVDKTAELYEKIRDVWQNVVDVLPQGKRTFYQDFAGYWAKRADKVRKQAEQARQEAATLEEDLPKRDKSSLRPQRRIFSGDVGPQKITQGELLSRVAKEAVSESGTNKKTDPDTGQYLLAELKRKHKKLNEEKDGQWLNKKKK